MRRRKGLTSQHSPKNSPTRMSPSTQPIRFYHRGQVVDVSGEHPTRSVLDWLREGARCTGTKEGCNEGDCGACTVVIGELAADNQLALHTVNACIQFLPTLHGKALFTVEDLKPMCPQPAKACGHGHDHHHGPVEQPLHPVQQAMVDCHGSQCGFCTPGFVMTLWNTYEQHQKDGTRPTRQQLADDLSGNLCRCTGYRPILDAGQKMFDLPAVRLDTAPVVQALQGLQRGDATFEYAAARDGRTDRFFAPRTLAELAALREAKPQARILAGSTDIGLWVSKQFRDLGDIIYVGDVAEMQVIEERGDELYIGAGASLEHDDPLCTATPRRSSPSRIGSASTPSTPRHTRWGSEPSAVGSPSRMTPSTVHARFASRSVSVRAHAASTATSVAVTAAPKPTIAGTFSMPPRRARSCAPPTTNGGKRTPRRTSSAAAPFGPPNLCAVTDTRSAPSAPKSTGR